ncbi:hypothetical protein [Plebeiibacterium marinum]|uniref:Uncharacterized protein n=1 Tax=Plebeiibacterium marinum TaxID=2992111 RepID=A0AAE3SJR4_9BACT|nr:hypothetical protein [Plebeiobacterium marinum]MCW3805764.1 hypothetical protein [Plebeiobacterium marinum]
MTSIRNQHTIKLFSTILNHISELVVGVDKIVGIYNQEDGNNLLEGISLYMQNGSLVEHRLEIDQNNQGLLQLQSDRIQYKWLNSAQVPFEERHLGTGQLNIFNEYENLILLISIPQYNSLKRNLVFIYFKGDFDQFGVQHDKAKLSTQNKSIIGHLISKSVISLNKVYWNQEAKLMRFARKSQEVIKYQKNSIDSVAKSEALENLVIGWVMDYLNNLSQAGSVNYVLQNEALQKITDYKGEFSELKKAIQEAAEYAFLLNSYSGSDMVTIEADFITLNTYVNNSEFTYENINLPPRLKKTHELLDRLEKYALKISHEGLSLTSYNVGKSMNRPITAAAISDSLSKNKDRINTLFKQFPDKWNFIKNNFRPIINVTARDNIHLKNWG